MELVRTAKRQKRIRKPKLYTFTASIEGFGKGHVWAESEEHAYQKIAEQAAEQVVVKAFEITGIKKLKKIC